MKTYLVGGSVRDELLGLPVQDRDYVVVGADPAEMLRQGFKPVGADFPVFLHPGTHAEYALARTERKTGPGYKGFSFHAAPSVTLEEDLLRRDLTINAMARDDDGRLVDPYGGAADLKAGILRHVSDAFAEDPVRILRVARFVARFGFAIAPETLALMVAMVHRGEADALVPERVWQEVARGLMEKSPSRMVAVLRECGALERILAELDATFSDPRTPERLAARLECAAAKGHALPVRYALLLLDTGAEPAAALGARVNAPADCRDLARLAIQHSDIFAPSAGIDAESLLGMLEHSDSFRRPERLERLIEVAQCAEGADGREARLAGERLRKALAAARAVEAATIAAEHPDDVAGAIRRARLVAIAALQPASGH